MQAYHQNGSFVYRKIASSKGQMISKAICVSLTSPKNEQKNEKIWPVTTMIYQVKSFSFVFLENLGHHKLLSKLTDL